ncbi:MAG: TonB family protein [Rikenellaceae bacterium]|nr:TonB family protein [Rikenellaceae bacterium]
MYYYNPDKRTGRVAASVATLLYFLTLALLFVLVKFTMPEEPEYGNGMLIDFGTVAEAGGATDPSMSEVDESASQPSSAPQPTEPQLTSDDEEAPEIAQQQKTQKPQPTQTQQQAKKPTDQTEQAPPRQVNKRALFSGRTQGSSSTSEGTSEGAGNQGEQGGSPEGSHDGMGQGSNGSFDLAGRGLIGGKLPSADYPSNYSGKVVVSITVDREGRVTKAVHQPVGSTTNAGVLVNAAINAARKARFTPSETQDIQTGTITYVFKLQ